MNTLCYNIQVEAGGWAESREAAVRRDSAKLEGAAGSGCRTPCGAPAPRPLQKSRDLDDCPMPLRSIQFNSIEFYSILASLKRSFAGTDLEKERSELLMAAGQARFNLRIECGRVN